MDILKKLTEELGIKLWQTESAVKLIDEGNTIPFISRYRKEATGSLNDEVLRNLSERLAYLWGLEDKKTQVLGSIEEQGKLTEELKNQILAAETLVAVDDLYRPYRPKRRTRGDHSEGEGPGGPGGSDPAAADEKTAGGGSEGLSLRGEGRPDRGGGHCRSRGYPGGGGFRRGRLPGLYPENHLRGGAALLRGEGRKGGKRLRDVLPLRGAGEEGGGPPDSGSEPGGEAEKVLTVRIEAPEERILRYLEKKLLIHDNPYTTPVLKDVIADSWRRLIEPSIEREIRSELTEKAEDGAIRVFGKNLQQLLMQPPIAGQVVLGWDPAFRTGCKLAVVDATGKVLDTTVIYPTAPQNKVAEAKAVLKKLIQKYDITLISLGNGTASRESEQVIVDLIKELPVPVKYVIVNEAGASVYSASKLATEEFPNFDVGQRSAASIARRLQDPLAELVKIDPKSIGVGQYQHDMNQKKLSEALTGVVEDCVNRVGVDLNTASASLLEYVSGISKTLAKNIVAYREENGRFQNRRQLLKVAKLGPKAFEQCAGFLRISGGDNPLDSTSVHPESYEGAEKLLASMGLSSADLARGGIQGLSKKVRGYGRLAEQLGVGEPTLRDIVKELEKPGRDPRDEMPRPILRTDVLEMKDLKPGMVLKGTVRNVIDFGAFVDIGVHQDGLVHISQMTDRYIKHPLEAVSVGDVVDVKVLSVDLQKKRIALTMKEL